MRVRPVEIAVPDDNPFANDALQRQKHVEVVFSLISNITESLVISVHGKWGSGKTTFLRMLDCLLRSNGYQTVFFNAWQNDYLDDPLPALLSETMQVIPASLKIKDKLKEASISLLKAAIPTAVKALTVGFLDINQLTAETIATIASEFANSQLTESLKAKETIVKFKSRLSLTVNSLGKKGSNLVIIID